MKAVIILNEGPYGSERSYNGMRLANSLRKHDPQGVVMVFLMGDAVSCAHAGQKPPEGFYNIGKMIHRLIDSGGQVLLCGTCMDARGLAESELVANAKRSTLDELTIITLAADKVLTF
ncbi:MAG: DsrE family protein [Alphaproteobacteria bacterium]|nr:DsrE family protein [Alphaproteobacteria bacterium]